MQQLALTAEKVALLAEKVALLADVDTIDEKVALLADVDTIDDVDTLMSLTEAKRLAAAEFERGYLVRVMKRAAGSVSEGARLAGLDRTNFRRLLQRHGLR